MSEADKTLPQRQQRLVERERKAGIARLLVRIPIERTDELKAIVKQWREQAKQQETQS